MAKRIFTVGPASVVIGVRLTVQQAEQVQEVADAAGLTVSDLARRWVLSSLRNHYEGEPIDGQIAQ
jgi:hypothetical protein